MKQIKKYRYFLTILIFIILFRGGVCIINSVRINNSFSNKKNNKHYDKICLIGKYNIVEIQKYKLPDKTDLDNFNNIIQDFYISYSKSDDIKFQISDKYLINPEFDSFLIDYCYKNKNPLFKFNKSYNAYGTVSNCERFVVRGKYFGKYCLRKSIDYFFVEEINNIKYLYDITFTVSEKKAFMLRDLL